MIGPARRSDLCQGLRLIVYDSSSNASEGQPALVTFCKSVIAQRSFFFISSSIYSDARHASAMIVSVGFLCVPEAKAEASITKRFFRSEERRVGKECRYRLTQGLEKKT